MDRGGDEDDSAGRRGVWRSRVLLDAFEEMRVGCFDGIEGAEKVDVDNGFEGVGGEIGK
jgi:hypothetical protein